MRTWTAEAREAILAQGPCGICGGPFARHRMIDAQMALVSAGEPIDEVADEYGLTVAAMVTEWAALIDLYEAGAS